MLIMQRFYKIRVPLCRQHGQQLATEWLLKTLVQGWWGYISFFVNVFDIGTDVVALVRFSRLTPSDQPVNGTHRVVRRRQDMAQG
jgi:hypothetical protein